ncbi:hypothetical protein [Pseudoalteromonas sp. ZZD1]|uniref:hypothetical protein n=1 Tax=Pseudoalteromonas sp. ZZD1 TaxID=3139395 RepID=UPI003BAC01FB
MNTEEFASKMVDAITYCKMAHIDHPKTQSDSVRFFDQKTPYINHPIWAASTILTETLLIEELRIKGYITLIFHDILEDTKLPLPSNIHNDIIELVEHMTFPSFVEERESIFQKHSFVRLLKCYDKVSNLLDASWVSIDKWNTYCEFTNQLLDDAEKNYGELNIIKLGRAVAIKKG